MDGGQSLQTKTRRARLVVLALGAFVLILAGSSCGGDEETVASTPTTPDRPVESTWGTIEDALSTVDFALWVPADVPLELELEGALQRDDGTSAELRYRQGEIRHSVTILQSTGDFTMGHRPSGRVEVQGTSALLLRGEDIGNPGLRTVEWRKDGITFVARAFPDDDFTEEEFLRFLNSLEPVGAQD